MDKKDAKKLSLAGRIAYTFVMNRRMSLLLIITLFSWGIFSFFITPKQYNPDIVAPAFQIITEYPGASAREVSDLVSKPIENKVSDIDGVDEVLSQSIEGGVSLVTVKFFVGESLEHSKIKLTQKIIGNIDLRPQGVSDPLIKEINPDDVPVMSIALSSDDLSEVALRKLAFDVRDRLRLIPDATNIEIIGGREYQLAIYLDPQKMVAKDISVFQVLEALQKNNVRYLAGDIELDESEILVEVDGQINETEDLSHIIVAQKGDDFIYLNEIGDLVGGPVEADSYVRYRQDGKKAVNTVFISVAKMAGKDIIPVTEAVESEMASLQSSLIPSMVDVSIVRNEGKIAAESVGGLMINLVQAIMIVFVVLLLFLGSRASLIVATAIPLTLASVFGIGFLAGQTINRITLFALILSLGLLVDNATVIVENAYRHIRMQKQKGYKSKQAAVIYSVNEVGKGLFMSTVTTLFAFFPMLFVTGMMGPYMGPIPFFVPAALLVSLLIAFTINPFLSSVMLNTETKSDGRGFIAEYKKRISDKFASWIEKYRQGLESILKDPLARKKIILVSLVIFLSVMTLPAFGLVKFRMLPKADKEQFYVYLDLSEGATVDKTKEVSERIEDLLLQNEEVLSVQSFVGEAPILDFNGLFKGAEGRNKSNQATIKVNLTHPDEREINSEDLVEALRPGLYSAMEDEVEARLKLVEDPPGPPVLSTVLLKVKGYDYERLKNISYDVEKRLADIEGVVDIDNSRTEEKKKLSLKLDHERVQKSGLDSESVAQALKVFLDGTRASILHGGDNKEQEFVFLRFKEEYRDQVEDMESIYLSNRQGAKVPLSELVKKEWKSVEDVIYDDNKQKTVYIYAEMSGRSVTYAVLDMYKNLWDYKLDNNNGKLEGVSFFGLDFIDKLSGEKYRIEWGGEWKLTVEVFRDLGAAMMVAIFLIYLVLVAQFHSFKTPVIIMMTIPLALIGVLPGFALLGATLGIYFNATSMIGVIALSGIVVNNAIILKEYIVTLRDEGQGPVEAIVEAAATRLRPILLTSLTTVLGSLTIIGDPVWAGLAWSIIFGISISTILTLFIFPVLYYTFKGQYWDIQEDEVRKKWSDIARQS